MAKEHEENKKKQPALPSALGGMGPSLVQLKDVKPFRTNCAGGVTPLTSRPDDQ